VAPATRALSRRAEAHAQLREALVRIPAASRATDGAPRIQAELQARGVRCGRTRLARGAPYAPRAVGGWAVTGAASTPRGAISAARVPPISFQRAFVAATPDQVWAANRTSIPPTQGFLFLAVVLDAGSRRLVGWSRAAQLRPALVVAALAMARQHRRPAAGVILHSDHGSHYTAQAFQDQCRAAGIRSSMGSVGDCSDNTMAESVFATLEGELLARHTCSRHAAARSALLDFIEVCSTRRRRHAALSSRSPERFESRFPATPVVA
jgi:putative transposase